MSPRPHPHTPLRALSAQHFAALHTAAATSHAPDSVLFPFLHGVEGDNRAQNVFFAGTSGAAEGCVRVPRFRGLVWVAADEDVEVGELPDNSDDEDELESEYDSDLDRSEPDAFGMPMDIDPPADSDPNAGAHMHPEMQRKADAPDDNSIPSSIPGPVNIIDYTFPYGSTTTGNHTHDRRDSTASHASFASTGASSVTSSLFDSQSLGTASTSLTSSCAPDSPCAENSQLAPLPENEQLQNMGSHTGSASPPPLRRPPILTSSFRARELLKRGPKGFEGAFVPPRVPDGISLRNFGIQTAVYATLSDIVVYSPYGDTRAAYLLAEKFKRAVEAKYEERLARIRASDALTPEEAKSREDDLVLYHVFVLDASPQELEEVLPHLVIRTEDEEEEQDSALASTLASAAGQAEGAQEGKHRRAKKANTVNFAQREKDEMRELTRASEIVSVFPAAEVEEREKDATSGSTTASKWDSSVGQIFLGNSNDVPMPPSEYCPLPQPRSSTPPTEEDDDPFHYASNDPAKGLGYDICIECHDAAPFPSSAHLRAAEEHVNALEEMWAQRCAKIQTPGAVRPPPNANSVVHLPFPSSPPSTSVTLSALMPFLAMLERLLAPVATTPAASGSTEPMPMPTSRPRASSGALTSLFNPAPPPPRYRSRPVKVLIYSSDGYTESSVLALSSLMYLRGLALPEAYLELQVTKRRSFFVYSSDVGVLKRIEQRVARERGIMGAAMPSKTWGGFMLVSDAAQAARQHQQGQGQPRTIGHIGRLGSNSVSVPASMPMAPGAFAQTMGPASLASESPLRSMGRPRASTSPMLPSLFDDHQAWFDDPRFDGSFPSRVLPFLYLGNLNHASNAYMLHALGITHVVSVGECALVPPQHIPAHMVNARTTGPQYVPGKVPGCHGSLWIEEREGRIKVLDIKGVCDDGIDTLEPQLAPICEWIDKARAEGGQVLVHCRVGVSRSATVVIAYVMKHLNIPLVDAYLIVRSRRLSVLIQPNLRLLYNLQGWEIQLARERAGNNEDRVREELARSLSWPYLSKEVHALNEKYLH
ncbi:hypothetical protein PUNSTDRAFT_86633 [Punctularia strigosozonata HHB-11173 SS5]|uniref:uncharacterized protein n=1 Tax=Punctularia strigosozonata (strain HHB-11173) TaxID=741275 RepID=UPI0004416A79|nr:uncharacterized protein PUNSTDRAFT_86633 [Punctularia strigosozonata HHB-11173 SS5]EIN10084.1 hypothetical protein PUNSTDRAFT_86633 [Punctularia strigosozonata HHB-11173 SS5]